MTNNDYHFHAYLLTWEPVLLFHEFTIEVRTTPVKNGGVRRKSDVVGYDPNGNPFMLGYPATATFIRYITDHIPGTKQDESTTTYQLDFGQLLPTFEAYRAVSLRKQKINNLLR